MGYKSLLYIVKGEKRKALKLNSSGGFVFRALWLDLNGCHSWEHGEVLLWERLILPIEVTFI